MPRKPLQIEIIYEILACGLCQTAFSSQSICNMYVLVDTRMNHVMQLIWFSV
jgi:hypothetical protein